MGGREFVNCLGSEQEEAGSVERVRTYSNTPAVVNMYRRMSVFGNDASLALHIRLSTRCRGWPTTAMVGFCVTM